VSSLTKDISEYLATLGAVSGVVSGVTSVAPRPLTVAYHSACSLQHGQKVHREPKNLLAACGFVVKEVPEAHLCCGSAGTYNILQPEIAGRLRDRKIENIAKTAPRRDRRRNIGCIAQIASGTAIPVVHPIELIDWRRRAGAEMLKDVSGVIADSPNHWRATWQRSARRRRRRSSARRSRAGPPEEGQSQEGQDQGQTRGCEKTRAEGGEAQSQIRAAA